MSEDGKRQDTPESFRLYPPCERHIQSMEAAYRKAGKEFRRAHYLNMLVAQDAGIPLEHIQDFMRKESDTKPKKKT